MKTWSINREIKKNGVNLGQPGMSLSGLLIRDGTLYFATLLCLNIASLVVDTTPQVNVNPVAAFIDTFTAILLSRLILNLRSFDTTNTTHDIGQHPAGTSNTREHMSSVQFASVLFDNIGASVSTSTSTRREDEDLEEMESTSQGEGTALTLVDVVKSPLAFGMEDDIRRIARARA